MGLELASEVLQLEAAGSTGEKRRPRGCEVNWWSTHGRKTVFCGAHFFFLAFSGPLPWNSGKEPFLGVLSVHSLRRKLPEGFHTWSHDQSGPGSFHLSLAVQSNTRAIYALKKTTDGGGDFLTALGSDLETS